MSLQIYEQKDFTGGLNFRSDQFQLADNESPEMLNVEIDPRGGVFSRGGMARINPDNVSGTWVPRRVQAFYGTSSKLMLVNNNNVYYQSSGGNFALLTYQYSGVTYNVTSTNSHGACLAAWGQTLYIATHNNGGQSGSDGQYKWTGAGFATALPRVTTSPNTWGSRGGAGGGHVPQCEHLAVHANRMFAAGTYEDGVFYPNRLRFSEDSLPECWVKEDYIDIEGGGTGITGMVVVNGSLVVFKPFGIYILFGYDHTDFQIVNVSTTLGCHNHAHMAATDTGVYFYSHGDGLFFFDGSNVVDVFQQLRPVFDFGYINPARDDAISVSWVGRRVWLSLPYSETTVATTSTVNLVFDPSIRAYTMFSTSDGKGVVSGCDFRADTGADLRLMCHPTVPAVLDVDDYDLGADQIAVGGAESGFSTIYRTKWFDAGSYMQRKMFRRPDLVMKESEVRMQLDVEVYHDFQESEGSEARTFSVVLPTAASGMFWDSDSWAIENIDGSNSGSVWSSGVVSSTIKTAKNLGLAKTVQLRFSGELKKPWGINSIGYKWAPRRVKG